MTRPDRPGTFGQLAHGTPRPGFLAPFSPTRTLTSLIWAADIHVPPDGRFVYVLERTSSR